MPNCQFELVHKRADYRNWIPVHGQHSTHLENKLWALERQYDAMGYIKDIDLHERTEQYFTNRAHEVLDSMSHVQHRRIEDLKDKVVYQQIDMAWYQDIALENIDRVDHLEHVNHIQRGHLIIKDEIIDEKDADLKYYKSFFDEPHTSAQDLENRIDELLIERTHLINTLRKKNQNIIIVE